MKNIIFYILLFFFSCKAKDNNNTIFLKFKLGDSKESYQQNYNKLIEDKVFSIYYDTLGVSPLYYLKGAVETRDYYYSFFPNYKTKDSILSELTVLYSDDLHNLSWIMFYSTFMEKPFKSNYLKPFRSIPGMAIFNDVSEKLSNKYGTPRRLDENDNTSNLIWDSESNSFIITLTYYSYSSMYKDREECVYVNYKLKESKESIY